jgi:hypothetical protein
MMWIRRIVSVPLIVLFFLLFVVVLVITQTNCTFGNPGFYNAQLRQADMYNFVYAEAMPAALDEIQTDQSSDFQIDISEIEDDLISAARKILPPEWLEERVESATETFIPYLLGGTDSFTYTVEFKDRVETAAEVIKNDIMGGEAFDTIYRNAISQAADEVLENLDKMPFSLTLSRTQVEEFLMVAADRDWIVSEVAKAIDAVTPYFTGDAEHSAITLDLRDRVEPVAAAVIDLLSTQEAYDYLIDELITPVILENIGPSIGLSYGITLSRPEIASALEEALSPSWVQARLADLINALADYIKGETDGIRIVVALSDVKAEALSVIVEMADDKLEAKFYSLPVCSAAEFLLATQNLPPGSLPGCRPVGVSYQEFKTMLNIDVAAVVGQKVGSLIPGQWVYTDADLRELLGEEDMNFLEDVRDKVADGWTFTEADLLDKLDYEGQQTLDDVRSWIKNGYTVTEADLRDRIVAGDGPTDSFDGVRHRINTARTWLWALWFIPFAFLVLIAFLCGRNWLSRAVWGLSVLFFTALIVFISVAVTFACAVKPRLDKGMFDPSEHEGVAALIVEKGNEVVYNIATAFAGNVKHMALYFMVASVVILFGLLVWQVVLPRARANRPQASS